MKRQAEIEIRPFRLFYSVILILGAFFLYGTWAAVLVSAGMFDFRLRSRS